MICDSCRDFIRTLFMVFLPIDFRQRDPVPTSSPNNDALADIPITEPVYPTGEN